MKIGKPFGPIAVSAAAPADVPTVKPREAVDVSLGRSPTNTCRSIEAASGFADGLAAPAARGAETTTVSVRPTVELPDVPIKVAPIKPVCPGCTVRESAVTRIAVVARAFVAFVFVRRSDFPETIRIGLPLASKAETTLTGAYRLASNFARVPAVAVAIWSPDTVCALVADVRRTMERTDRSVVLIFMASLRY
jgi:hypothetical protein